MTTENENQNWNENEMVALIKTDLSLWMYNKDLHVIMK